MDYADLPVRPFAEESPGFMQAVCVESASHVVIERWIEGKPDPEVVLIGEQDVSDRGFTNRPSNTALQPTGASRPRLNAQR